MRVEVVAPSAPESAYERQERLLRDERNASRKLAIGASLIYSTYPGQTHSPIRVVLSPGRLKWKWLLTNSLFLSAPGNHPAFTHGSVWTLGGASRAAEAAAVMIAAPA